MWAEEKIVHIHIFINVYVLAYLLINIFSHSKISEMLHNGRNVINIHGLI